MKRWLVAVSADLLLLSCGCATFSDHPDPKVSYPATVACYTGQALALPVDIVLAPVLYPIGYYMVDPTGKLTEGSHLGGFLLAISPSILTGLLFENTFGAFSWLLFGWWGNEQSDPSHLVIIPSKPTKE